VRIQTKVPEYTKIDKERESITKKKITVFLASKRLSHANTINHQTKMAGGVTH